MKTTLTLASLSAALLVAGLVHAADPAPAGAAPAASSATAAPTATARLSLTEAYQRLRAAGYRDVSELQRKRTHIEAEATDRNGRRVELTLDRATAAVLRSKLDDDAWRPTPNALDIGQVLARLEAAGYREVREVELDRDEVEVHARDAQGRRVKLHLDPLTGALRTTEHR